MQSVIKRTHRTVMLYEVCDFINVNGSGYYADLTFGEGGHTEELLHRGAKKVFGIDRDLEALDLYRGRAEGGLHPNLELIHGKAIDLKQWASPSSLDGIVVDLGVSTRQILHGPRGFSLQNDGPLDMRMDTSSGETLAEILDRIDPDDLATALSDFGDIKNAQYMANKILSARQAGDLNSTLALAKLSGPRRGRSHPATALFMALRILVNDELHQLRDAIPIWIECLKPGGRIAILSFHSSEDRIVKQSLQRLAGKCICRVAPCVCLPEMKVSRVLKKPMIPSWDERKANRRSRSAKLRCVEKLSLVD